MKKAILLLCMAAGLMGCAKEILNTGKETPQNEGVPMTFDVTVLETKAAKTAWANGDKIYVFFNGLATKYLVLERSSGNWTNTSGGDTLLDSDFSGLGTKKLTAVHFPVDVTVTYADSKFSFTSGGKPVYNYYLFEKDKDYTVSGTTVTATLSMGKPADMVQIHVAGIQDNVSDYTFGCSKIKPVACESVGTDGAVTESVLQAGARLSGVADSDGGIFAGRLTKPGEAADYTFTVASDDNIYTLTRTNKTLTAGKMYNFPSLSTTGGDNWAVQNASDLYVDLGITVGGKKIYWAKYNLGATSETGYGDYYAWGETAPYYEDGYASETPGAHWKTGKTGYNWASYQWRDGSTFSKYTGSDYSTLQAADDAAYAALGGKFRMPTEAEIEALLALSKEWVTDYNSSGINGYKFTGNGNTLFLPAAGYRDDTGLYYAGSQGYYWSSSLNTDLYSAWRLQFLSGSASRSSYDRNRGFPVRPVSE